MRFLLAFAISLFLTVPARAGDVASARPLGFSPGGAYFAFSQSGVQDGSGFAYADVFVIDTARDAWVKGTPVRVLIRNETSTGADALRMAMRRAAGVLRKLKITGGGNMTILAHNPLTEWSADPKRVAFSLSAENPTVYSAYRLRLIAFDVPMKDCESYGAKARGFRLVLSPWKGTGGRVIHADKAGARLPKSRGCALDYRITHVISHDGVSPKQGIPLVALVEVFAHGFEGRDGRFIALPFFIRN